MQNDVEDEKQEEMMEHEEAEETDGHSSGQRGLQAQVMIRLVFSMFQVIQTDGIFQV